MQPITATIWPNGGSDPKTMWATPRKVEQGWHQEIAVQIRAGELELGASMRIVHLPWGCLDPANMEFDALRNARELKLTRLADPVSFHWAFRTLAACRPEVENRFYLGGLEASPRLMALWQRSRSQWTQAVDSAMRPIIKLAEAGLKVGVFIDAAAMRDEKSPSAAACRRIGEHWRLPWGVEARIQVQAESWANRADVDVLCTQEGWHAFDPGEHPEKVEIVPTERLKGRQILIIRDGLVGGMGSKARAEAEKAAGRSVAVIEYRAAG